MNKQLLFILLLVGTNIYGASIPVDAIRSNDLEAIKAYLGHGGDVNERSESGSTALMTAASFGSVPVVKLLLQNGADPNLKNSWDQTALILASYSGRLSVVKILAKLHSEIDAMDRTSMTALMHAAEQGHPRTVLELIRAGSDVNFRNFFRWSAIMYASQTNHPRTIRTLLSSRAETKDCNSAALLGAAERGEPEYLKQLLKSGADPNFLSVDPGWPPLVYAVSRDRNYSTGWMWDEKTETMIPVSTGQPPHKPSTDDYLEVVRALLEAGADPNGRGSFPLMFASVPDVVDLLIQSGANVHARTSSGNTALITAAGSDFSGRVVQRLLQAGAEVNASSKNGITPLYMATQAGNYYVAKLLFAAGADPNAGDQEGNTPITIAQKNGNQMFLRLFASATHNQH